MKPFFTLLALFRDGVPELPGAGEGEREGGREGGRKVRHYKLEVLLIFFADSRGELAGECASVMLSCPAIRWMVSVVPS